jgi:hypothetical protein
MDLKKLIKEVLESRKHDCGCGCGDKCGKAPILNESLQSRVLMTDNMKYHIDNKKPLTENTFRYGSKAFLDLWAEARYLYSREAVDAYGLDKEIITETKLGEYGLFEGKMVPLDLPMVKENTDDVVAILNNPNIEDDVKSMLFNAYKSGKLTSTQVINIIKKTVKEHLNEAQMLDNYEVDFFHTKANVYANIEISSENPTFEDDIQIKGIGKTEEEAFKDLKQNYENYKKTKINEAEFKGKEVQLGKPKRGGSKKFYVYVRDPKTKKVKKVSFGDTTGLSAKINNPKARKAFAARHKCGTGEPKTSAKYWSCRLPRYSKLLGLKNSFSGFW